MPEDRLAERLAQARRLASEARLDRLDQALAGLRADAVTDGGVPADLEIEFAVIRSAALLNLERPAEAWDVLQGVLGRLDEATPTMQARLHAMSGGAAYWFGDHDTAIDETVLALAVLADVPPSTERAMATASCGLNLAYCRLFPLAAEVLGQALDVAAAVSMPSGRLHAQAQYVQLTWGMSLDHLGLAEDRDRCWEAVVRHHALAVADGGLPDMMLALSHAERALLAGRLGDAATARDGLRRAEAVPVGARSPSLVRLLAHAEGAALFAEGRLDDARRTLLRLWDSVRERTVPVRTDDVPLLLARVDEAAGRPADALRWYRVVYGRYGRTQQESWQARETAARLKVEQEALLRRSRELEADTLTDPLTGLPNRRALDAELATLIPAVQAAGEPFALAVLDVDRFKWINDEHGHPIGDEVLRIIGRVLRERCEECDRFARYGGDEFVLCVPAPLDQARAAIAAVVAVVAGQDWSEISPRLRVTIGWGIAALGPDDTATSLFEAADRELLAAKRGRRHLEPVPAAADL
ncbi:MAG TPA: GGDEF domain-containing protein [Mycobacteriales bacterium]|jgi:diguanylate cyclase (GGDEF)-like protein|nr:GGDEF domain-containing protein [Mycobacteriales bacterium]